MNSSGTFPILITNQKNSLQSQLMIFKQSQDKNTLPVYHIKLDVRFCYTAVKVSRDSAMWSKIMFSRTIKVFMRISMKKKSYQQIKSFMLLQKNQERPQNLHIELKHFTMSQRLPHSLRISSTMVSQINLPNHISYLILTSLVIIPMNLAMSFQDLLVCQNL